jgi:hypothetical protein
MFLSPRFHEQLIETLTTPGEDAGESPVTAGDSGGPTSRWKRLLPAVGWAAAFGIIPLILVTLGIETAVHFGGPPIDGPFQVFNALRRIMAGQRGGVEFQFFHGIGLPYLMYVPFRLFGGTFAASEVTRQFVATLSAPVAVLVFMRVFTGEWRRAFALSTVVLALSIALGLWPMLLAVNSLLVVRAALPTMAPVIWVLPIRPRVRAVLMGTAIGGSVLLGTEQGLAVFLAFLIVGGVMIVRTSTPRRAAIQELLLAIVVAAGTIVIAMMAIGGFAGLKGALYYNLKLVPMDQYWYFGVPPNLFITGWTALPRLMLHEPKVPLALFFGTIAVAHHLRGAWRQTDDARQRRHVALAMLVLYGLIACVSLLGMFNVAYVEPCIRAVLIVGALASDDMIRKHSPTLRAGWRRGLQLPWITAAALLVMVFRAPTMMQSFASRLPEVVGAHLLRGQGMRLEGLWPATVTSAQRIIDERRSSNGSAPTLWSTYAGLLEAKNGMFQPSTDYIIHVLGPEARAKYVADFRAARPVLVQTVRPTYSEYEIWIEQTSWDFYRELLRNYRTVDATPWSIFWERLPTPAEEPKEFWSARLAPGSRSVEIAIPASPTGHADAMLMQVELTYRVHNALAKLPIIGASPRYLVVPSGAITSGPVTIDPYTTTTRFPMIAVEGGRVTLRFATYSLLPGADIEVSAVRAAQIPITRANYPWLNDLAKAIARPAGPIER